MLFSLTAPAAKKQSEKKRAYPGPAAVALSCAILLILSFFAQKMKSQVVDGRDYGRLLGWEMRLHLSSPASGTDADDLVECTRECCLVVEAGLRCDIGQRHVRLGHQEFGVVDAMLNQPLVGGDAE
jgi:hypothetical protein